MKTKIPLSVPSIQGNEWKYTKECLDAGLVSSVGEYVRLFDEMVAKYTKARYAVATVNGTCALHVSLTACGVESDDEVIVPSITFIAPVNTVKYCNAEPVFMDCEPETLCLDVRKVSEFIKKNTFRKNNGFTYNKNSGRRIKAVIPVHIFGHPVDMDHLIEICSLHRIDIIEDATESLGSEYRGRKTGTFGKVGCLSFNGNKIITTGGGGMVISDDKKLIKRILHLTTQAKTDSIEYNHDAIGFNYRLTNLQAAMGIAQMEKLDEYIKIKRENAQLFRDLLSRVSEVEFLWEKPWAKSNFWFYTIKVYKKHKKRLINFLLSKGIEVRPIWKPIHTLPMYKTCQTYKIENTNKAYQTCINLPCSVNLKNKEIKFVVKNIKDYCARYSK